MTKTSKIFILLLSFALALPVAATAKNPESNPNNYLPNQVIVKYKKDKVDLKTQKGEEQQEKIKASLEAQEISQAGEFNLSLIKTKKSTEEALKELRENPDVEIAEPNYIRRPSGLTTDDLLFSNQWYLHNTGQSVNGTSGTTDADIDAPEAWEAEPSLSNEVIVAVIDSGARHTHYDLSPNMWDGSSGCVDENNSAITGGCPNHGWDYENDDNNPSDDDGHGTFVSGLVGARTNNAHGISGISYNNKTKIMALRFGFDTFSEVKAISFAKNNGAKIINASYIGENFSALEKDAIESFDGLFVAAAGNGGTDEIGDNNDSTPMYPASYDSSNIISIAATDQNDQLASFSNYGLTSVDVTAPGDNMTSTYNTGDNTYVIANGTSAAAPIVAGVASVLFQKNPSLSTSQVKSRILLYGDDKQNLLNKIKTGKRVNLYRSINPNQNSSTSNTSVAPTHRYSNVDLGAYFYTSSIFEKQDLDENSYGFTYQGVGFYSFDHEVSGTVPVYRFANPELGIYFYTTSPTEKDYLLNNDPGFTYQGVGFYAYNYPKSGTAPVYRFANRNSGFYFYTSSVFEKDDLLQNGYGFEYQGVGFYAYDHEI